MNAGHEATVNALGNGVLALLQRRSEWERLAAAPSLLPSAVAELLRFDTPLQLFRRTALADAEVGGTAVAAGEQVAPLARLELQEELRALLLLAPGLELAGAPVRKPGHVIRGLDALPVSA